MMTTTRCPSATETKLFPTSGQVDRRAAQRAFLDTVGTRMDAVMARMRAGVISTAEATDALAAIRAEADRLGL